jgi:hypothetical protein
VLVGCAVAGPVADKSQYGIPPRHSPVFTVLSEALTISFIEIGPLGLLSLTVVVVEAGALG